MAEGQAARRYAPVGDGVLSGEGLFVGQQQALVRRVEVALRKGRGARVDTDGLHEAQRLVHLVAHGAVLAARGERLDKVEVPSVQAGHVGVTAHAEGAQDVERLRGLVVGVEHALRVVRARLLGEFLAVDDVAAVRGQGHAVDDLVGLGARLGKLPGHAAHLDDRHGSAKGHHQGHLQHHAEGITHMIDAKLVESLGAVAAHEQKTLPERGLGQVLLQRAHLACKHERRALLQLAHHGVDGTFIGIIRGLLDGEILPAAWRPHHGLRIPRSRRRLCARHAQLERQRVSA